MNLTLLREIVRQKRPLPKLIPLAAFPFLTVHPATSWPTVGGKVTGKLIADKTFSAHTTQSFVSGEVVERKMRKIRHGERPSTSAVFRDNGETWLFNGHHTLVAYALLGLPPIVEIYDPKLGKRLGPPRFVDKRGKPLPRTLRAPDARSKGGDVAKKRQLASLATNQCSMRPWSRWFRACIGQKS